MVWKKFTNVQRALMVAIAIFSGIGLYQGLAWADSKQSTARPKSDAVQSQRAMKRLEKKLADSKSSIKELEDNIKSTKASKAFRAAGDLSDALDKIRDQNNSLEDQLTSTRANIKQLKTKIANKARREREAAERAARAWTQVNRTDFLDGCAGVNDDYVYCGVVLRCMEAQVSNTEIETFGDDIVNGRPPNARVNAIRDQCFA